MCLNNRFELTNHAGYAMGGLQFLNNGLENCQIEAEQNVSINLEGPGFWHLYSIAENVKKRIGSISFTLGGIMEIKLYTLKKRYQLKRLGNFNSRFCLITKKGEEITEVKPHIDWLQRKYELFFQINMEYHTECSNLLLLITAHCAITYINMLNGAMPAILNV